MYATVCTRIVLNRPQPLSRLTFSLGLIPAAKAMVSIHEIAHAKPDMNEKVRKQPVASLIVDSPKRNLPTAKGVLRDFFDLICFIRGDTPY